MITFFSINIKGKEFSMRGVADVHKKIGKFQALLNGVPFAESANYEKVRVLLIEATKIEKSKGENLH